MSSAEEKREAADRAKQWPKRFTWNAVKITIGDPNDWSGTLMRELEQGHAMSVVAELIGPVAWAQIEKRPVRELAELANTIMVKAGFTGADAGE
jgi:hypothetical protein